MTQYFCKACEEEILPGEWSAIVWREGEDDFSRFHIRHFYGSPEHQEIQNVSMGKLFNGSIDDVQFHPDNNLSNETLQWGLDWISNKERTMEHLIDDKGNELYSFDVRIEIRADLLRDLVEVDDYISIDRDGSIWISNAHQTLNEETGEWEAKQKDNRRCILSWSSAVHPDAVSFSPVSFSLLPF